MHCTAVTHGHLDHVGALPLLLKLYPDMKVVIHEAEGPYLQGLKKYFSKDGLSLQMRALHFLKVVPGTEFQVTQYCLMAHMRVAFHCYVRHLTATMQQTSLIHMHAVHKLYQAKLYNNTRCTSHRQSSMP